MYTLKSQRSIVPVFSSIIPYFITLLVRLNRLKNKIVMHGSDSVHATQIQNAIHEFVAYSILLLRTYKITLPHKTQESFS